MSDFSLPLEGIHVVGKSGSGKNTWVYRYLLNCPGVTCRFIFDFKGECLQRLKIPHAGTANEMEAALQTRWVNVNPHRMFPGEVKEACRSFSKWTFAACKRGRGKKIVFIDEIWRFQDRDDLPIELATLAQMGRSENITFVTASQHPHLTNAGISGNLSELVCFLLDESRDLNKISNMGAKADDVAALPKGTFIAYNKDTGGTLRHKLFNPPV